MGSFPSIFLAQAIPLEPSFQYRPTDSNQWVFECISYIHKSRASFFDIFLTCTEFITRMTLTKEPLSLAQYEHGLDILPL